MTSRSRVLWYRILLALLSSICQSDKFSHIMNCKTQPIFSQCLFGEEPLLNECVNGYGWHKPRILWHAGDDSIFQIFSTEILYSIPNLNDTIEFVSRCSKEAGNQQPLVCVSSVADANISGPCGRTNLSLDLTGEAYVQLSIRWRHGSLGLMEPDQVLFTRGTNLFDIQLSVEMLLFEYEVLSLDAIVDGTGLGLVLTYFLQSHFIHSNHILHPKVSNSLYEVLQTYVLVTWVSA